MNTAETHHTLLAEQLLLLAFDDVKGSVLPAARIALDFGLAGALLMELALRGDLKIDHDKLSFAETTDNADSGHPLLDETRRLIQDKPGKRARYWVQQLPRRLHGLRQRLLDGLVNKGTLQQHESRVLFIFHRKTFPELDHQVEHDIRQHIDATLLHGNAPDARTKMLIQLAGSCRLIKAMYPREQRQAVQKRLKTLEDAPIASDVDAATQAAISAAATAAAMVAITAATTASTTAACSAASSSC